MTATATVRYCGVLLHCTYDYSPAESATRTDPGWPEQATLETCKVAGVDIYEMLTTEQREEIEALLLEARADAREAALADRADMEREERALGLA